jgi:transcriptional regulator with XRE-family HTH domain
MGKQRDPIKAYKAIGLKIRSIREKRGWTLEHCEELGWSSWQQLQKIESGRNITVRTLINLSNLFDVHPSELLKDIR